MPPYFAKRLSFPEPVTPWNAAQLAAAVRAGPDALPGAVAVEDEQGRMVSLATLAPEVRLMFTCNIIRFSCIHSSLGGHCVPPCAVALEDQQDVSPATLAPEV